MRFLAAMCLCILITSCKMPYDEVTVLTGRQPTATDLAALNDIKTRIVGQFNQYNNAMRMAAVRLSQEKMKGTGTLGALQRLQETTAYVRMSGSLDLDSQRIEVYPQVYFQKAGLEHDIPDAARISQLTKSCSSYLGKMFTNQMNVNVVNYSIPVYETDHIVQGAVYVQIAVTKMLDNIVKSQIQGLNINIWVMQKDGLIIYDTNHQEIGLNIFKDEPFINFPNLQECAMRIIRTKSGTGTYSYATKGQKIVRQKNAQWDTIVCGDREWRIILNLEDQAYDSGTN